MVVQIRNTNNGMEHVERHVLAITESADYIELVYDDTYGVVTGKKYPKYMYKVVKFRKG